MCRAMLARFNFVGDKVYQRVESLSGGEKTRLSIALITAQPSNLLILDEPTTYLDVLSQRIILEAIKEYKGTMLVVSHNPEFIKELKPDRAFLLPEGRGVFWDNSLLDRVEEM
jgi:ATP-binding cassette, subfamily F, member 3